MPQIIDNFLHNDDYKNISDFMMSHNFSWYIQQHTDLYGDNNKQLTHVFYDSLDIGFRPNSVHFDLLQPIIKKLNIQALIRIKANLTFIDNKTKNVFHNDIPGDSKNKTALYYLTEGGGTEFEEGNQYVEAIPNRMVVFSNKDKHKVIKHQTDEPFRAVINFNYF